MTVMRSTCGVAALLGWGLCCPSAAASASRTVTPMAELPAPLQMNRGAGEGMLLLIDLHTEDGKTFPCAVDTGSPNTDLPASLEPTLGKRLGSRRFSTLDSPSEVEHLYAAPKLYLGNTQLATGPQVGAWGTLGVLGMDCLRHYCVQLDFQARTVRFLSSDQLKVAGLGKSFLLTKSPYAAIKHAGLFQNKDGRLLVDTGCPFDGYLDRRVFRRVVREQHAEPLPLLKDGVVQGTAPGLALFSSCIWEHETYTNLIVGKGLDLVGLKFLGRHLVTFDFPRGMLYLKRTDCDNPSPKGLR